MNVSPLLLVTGAASGPSWPTAIDMPGAADSVLSAREMAAKVALKMVAEATEIAA